MHTFLRGAVVPCLIIGAALGLIYIEPDRGTCFLMAIVTGTMLTMVGVRWHHLVCLALIAGCLVAATSKHDTMRSNRIKAWWHPEEDKTGVSSQGKEAKKAFGHGGLTGVGLGNGLQKNGYVAEMHSDFIFANIGEELGLVATLSVVAAFFMITLCGFEIARQSRDQFGCLLAVGITMLISCQAIFNMAVVTSVVPNKGIALPFISAGGSNLIAMLGCVGVLISIARHATQLKTVPPDFAPDANPFAAKAA